MVSSTFGQRKKMSFSFYRTTAWVNTREKYKQSVGNLCERCMAKGIITPAEIVHHKIPLTKDNVNDPNITLSWDNLEALCRKCHAEVHDEIYRKRTGRRYVIGKGGEVIISPF